MRQITTGADETSVLAARWLADFQKPQSVSATVLALTGDLGSGKTVFVSALAARLGVRAPVASPTFIIEKIYPLTAPSLWRWLHHYDCYRLRRSEELAALGFREVIADPRRLVAVEWAEKVNDLLPVQRVNIIFRHLDGDRREITVEKS